MSTVRFAIPGHETKSGSALSGRGGGGGGGGVKGTIQIRPKIKLKAIIIANYVSNDKTRSKIACIKNKSFI